LVVLKVHDIECAYGSARVLNGLTFSIERGGFTGVIGPNGSGKSTVLRCISRVLKPVRGSVFLDEHNLYGLSALETARKMAVVPQETAVNFSFTVEEVVLMGRSPYLGRFQAEGKRDFEVAARAMELTNTGYLADRLITAISGGERQKVIIAKALAQEPKIILLDEPTSHLDINHQIEILNLLQRLNREAGLTVISVFHDLNLASQYCDDLILMQNGAIFALGKPGEVLTAGIIKNVYGADVLVKKHPVTGRPTVMPLARVQQKNKPQGRVHVVCGGGEGAVMLALLVNHGYDVTAGVINAGDVDWETARLLGIETAEEAPFCLISKNSHEENIRLIKSADACIMVSIPFGRGNLKNLEALSLARDWGKPVLVLEERDIGERDFTGGQAGQIYDELKKKGAVVLKDKHEILKRLKKII